MALKTLLVILIYPKVLHPGCGVVLVLLSNFPRTWFTIILQKRKKIWESDCYFALGLFFSGYSILIVHTVELFILTFLFMFVAAILSQELPLGTGWLLCIAHLLEATDGTLIKRHFVASVAGITSSSTGLKGNPFGSSLLLFEFAGEGY